MSIGVVDGPNFQRSFQLAKGIVKRGDQVWMLVTTKSGVAFEECRDGVNLVAFSDPFPGQIRKGGGSPMEIVGRILWMIGKKFDVVVSDCGFRPTTYIPSRFYRAFNNVPYVCEWWDWIGRGGQYERKSKLYQNTLGLVDNYFESADKRTADGVVALSECLRDRAIELGLSAGRTCIVHGGSDVSGRFTWPKSEARSSLGIGEKAFVVGFAGMDSQEVENLVPFLEVIHDLKGRGEFCWFSTGGSLRDDIRAKFSVGEEYREFGWVDYETYKKCLCAADVLLLTQEDTLLNRARWPNKLGDYLAAGRLVLATRVGDIVRLSEEFPSIGIEYVNWSSGDILNALNRLRLDLSSTEERGLANAKYAVDNLSWDRKAMELGEFLEQVRIRYAA